MDNASVTDEAYEEERNEEDITPYKAYLMLRAETKHRTWRSKEETIELYALNIYLRDIRRIPFLSHSETVSLIRRAQEHYDQEAKRKVIESHLPLVVYAARRWQGMRLLLEDLIQEGNIGLIRAVELYDDYLFEAKFSSFAFWHINANIRRAVILNHPHMHVPVYKQELWTKIKTTVIKFQNFTQRKPTTEELSLLLGIPAQKLEWEMASMNRYFLSGDERIGDDTDSPTLFERSASAMFLTPEKELMAREELRLSAQSLLRFCQTMREWCARGVATVRLRYGVDDTFEPRTLEEVGKIAGISRERVRQIVSVAWKKLANGNEPYTEEWLEDQIFKIHELMDLLNEKITLRF